MPSQIANVLVSWIVKTLTNSQPDSQKTRQTEDLSN